MNENKNPRLYFLIDYLREQKANGIRNWRFASHSAHLMQDDSYISIDFGYCRAGTDVAVLTFPNNPNNYYVRSIKDLEELLTCGSALGWPVRIIDKNTSQEYIRIRNVSRRGRLNDSEKEHILNYITKMADEYTSRHPDIHYTALKYLHKSSDKCLAIYCEGEICVYKSLFDECERESQCREVILHELCHSAYLSHGKRFWSLLNDKIVAEKMTNVQWFHPNLFIPSRKNYPDIKIPL